MGNARRTTSFVRHFSLCFNFCSTHALNRFWEGTKVKWWLLASHTPRLSSHDLASCAFPDRRQVRVRVFQRIKRPGVCAARWMLVWENSEDATACSRFVYLANRNEVLSKQGIGNRVDYSQVKGKQRRCTASSCNVVRRLKKSASHPQPSIVMKTQTCPA